MTDIKSIKNGVLIGIVLSALTSVNIAYASFGATPEEIVECTNKHRATYDLAPVVWNNDLAIAAAAKIEDMKKYKYWAHVNPETGKEPWAYFDEVKYDYMTAGENLAFDFQDAEKICDSWMRSPTHRANILDNTYKEIGVAIEYADLEIGTGNLIAQMFGSRSGEIHVDSDLSKTSNCKEKTFNGIEIISPKCDITNLLQPEIKIETSNAKDEIVLELNGSKFQGEIISRNNIKIGQWKEEDSLKDGINTLDAYLIGDENDKATSVIYLDTIPPSIEENSIEIESEIKNDYETYKIKARFLDENFQNAYIIYANHLNDYITEEFKPVNSTLYGAEIIFRQDGSKDHPATIKALDKANNISEKGITLMDTEFELSQQTNKKYIKVALVILGVLSMILLIMNLYKSYRFGVFDKVHFAGYVVLTIVMKLAIILLFLRLI